LVNKWVDSRLEDFDIWDVTIETYDVREKDKKKDKCFSMEE